MGMVHPDTMAIVEGEHFVCVIAAQFACIVTAFQYNIWGNHYDRNVARHPNVNGNHRLTSRHFKLSTCLPVCKGTLWLNVFYDQLHLETDLQRHLRPVLIRYATRPPFPSSTTVCVCVCVRIHVFVCVCAFMRICLCACVCMHVFTCKHMCVLKSWSKHKR